EIRDAVGDSAPGRIIVPEPHHILPVGARCARLHQLRVAVIEGARRNDRGGVQPLGAVHLYAGALPAAGGAPEGVGGGRGGEPRALVRQRLAGRAPEPVVGGGGGLPVDVRRRGRPQPKSTRGCLGIAHACRLVEGVGGRDRQRVEGGV